MINYIHLLNWFWEDVPYRTGYKSEYGSMFLSVVDSCNRNSWRATSVEYDRMQSKVRVGKRMYYEAIKWLVAESLITYQPGRNEYASAVFDLHETTKVEVQKCTTASTSTAPLLHHSRTTASTSTAPSIYKPLNSETTKPLNEEVGDADASDLNVFDEESFSTQKKGKPPTPVPAAPSPSPPKPTKANKEHFFKESPYYARDAFIEALLGTDYGIYDLAYYHETVKNWADSGSTAKHRKADWLATARNFMLRDANEGKAKLRQDLQPINGNNGNRSNNSRPGRETDAEFASSIDALADWKYRRGSNSH